MKIHRFYQDVIFISFPPSLKLFLLLPFLLYHFPHYYEEFAQAIGAVQGDFARIEKIGRKFPIFRLDVRAQSKEALGLRAARESEVKNPRFPHDVRLKCESRGLSSLQGFPSD